MSKFSILSVDDDALIQKLIFEVLSVSYDVNLVSSGEECLAKIDSLSPDLIILDVMMPGGMDGYETCRLLKQKKTIKNIPIIFVSAQSSEAERLKGFESGGTDYILKPFDAKRLSETIDTNLALARENDHQKNLKSQLNSSTKSAIDALKYSIELNQVINFYERSSEFESLEKVASEVLNVTTELGLRSVVQIRFNGDTQEYSDFGVVTPLERQVIAEQCEVDVFYKMHQHLMISYSNISILIKNMPNTCKEENQIDYQKLKETVRALTFAANSSILKITTENYSLPNRTAINFTILIDIIMMKLQNKSDVYHRSLESLLQTMKKAFINSEDNMGVIDNIIGQAKLLCINKTDLATIRAEVEKLIEIMNEDRRSSS